MFCPPPFSQIDGFLVQRCNVFGCFSPVRSIPFFCFVKKVGIFGITGGLLGTYDEEGAAALLIV